MEFTIVERSSIRYRRVVPYGRILPAECSELVFAGEDGSILVPLTESRRQTNMTCGWRRLNQTRDPNGYWHVSVYEMGGGLPQYDVQKIIALAWHGKPEGERNTVRHLNPPIDNNCADNLIWGTREEQERDKELTRDRKKFLDAYLAAYEIRVVRKGRDWIAYLYQEDKRVFGSDRKSSMGRPRENPASAVNRIKEELRRNLDDPGDTIKLVEKTARDFEGHVADNGYWLPRNAKQVDDGDIINRSGAKFHSTFNLCTSWNKIEYNGS